MAKIKINAAQVVRDIRSGMDDPDLMGKYNLSAKGLQSLFRKLVQVYPLAAAAPRAESIRKPHRASCASNLQATACTHGPPRHATP